MNIFPELYQLYPILEVPGLYYYFNEKGNRVVVAHKSVSVLEDNDKGTPICETPSRVNKENMSP